MLNFLYKGLGVASLLIGIVCRITATLISSTCSDFTWKEKIFICISWLPKATVQAAVGSLALDIAKEKGNEDEIRLGNEVLFFLLDVWICKGNI